jgi:hypothetical protein
MPPASSNDDDDDSGGAGGLAAALKHFKGLKRSADDENLGGSSGAKVKAKAKKRGSTDLTSELLSNLRNRNSALRLDNLVILAPATSAKEVCSWLSQNGFDDAANCLSGMDGTELLSLSPSDISSRVPDAILARMIDERLVPIRDKFRDKVNREMMNRHFFEPVQMRNSSSSSNNNNNYSSRQSDLGSEIMGFQLQNTNSHHKMD